jgi:hypothetical protein
MQKIDLRYMNQSAGNPAALLAILVTWLLVMAGVGIWLILDNDTSNPIKEYYLIPWVIVSGVITCAPSLYFLYKGKFDLFHPLVFAAWAYILPCLVGGGLLVAFGWSDFYFLNYISDPEYNLPLTLIYVSIGYIGLTVGYALPIGKMMGTTVETWFPKWEWTLGHTWVAGYLLVMAGTVVNIIGFLNGLLGFQRFDQVEAFDGLIFFLLIMFFQGYFLLWYALFKTPNKDSSYLVTLVMLVLLIPLRMAIMGNRGSIYLCILPITFAYIVSGKKVTLKHGVLFSALLVVGVFVGMIYGTTFRNIKGSETRLGAGDYIGQIGATLDYLSEKDASIIFADASQSLINRLENLSSLGVIVSNYEKLAPYEESYGLANNILRDTYTAFIPRFLWNDKPLTSDAHAYSDLYFDYESNAFAITPWGDLLRNFGPIGIPIGMLLLGIFLRVLYTALGTPVPGGQWRSSAYYLLLTTISYEAFYATIFPSLVRVSVVLIVTLYLANLIAKRTGTKWRFSE